MQGLCDICGKAAELSSCMLCGKRVCSSCFVADAGVCRLCVRGRQVKK